MDITDEMYTVADSIHEASNVWKEPSSGDQQSFQDQIRSRLQHLELELTSVLCLLRTNTDSAVSNKVYILPFVSFIHLSTPFLLLILLLRLNLPPKQSLIFLGLHNTHVIQKISPSSGPHNVHLQC